MNNRDALQRALEHIAPLIGHNPPTETVATFAATRAAAAVLGISPFDLAEKVIRHARKVKRVQAMGYVARKE